MVHRLKIFAGVDCKKLQQ